MSNVIKAVVLNLDEMLAGTSDLLYLLDKANVRAGGVSLSQNARAAAEALGIADRLTALVDGHPTPHLFRYAAMHLGLLPGECLALAGTAAGVEAALQAGMPCLAWGPAAQYSALETRYGPLPRRDNLEGVELRDLEAAMDHARTWWVMQADWRAEHQHHMETIFTTGNGYFCSRGSLEEGYPGDHALTLAHGVFDDAPIVFTELANLPNWLDLAITVDGQPFRLDQGRCLRFSRGLDLRHGILHRVVRWQAPDGTVLDLAFERFASYTYQHIGALRLSLTAVNRACQVTVAAGINGHVSNEDLLHWQHLAQGQDGEATVWLASRTRHSALDLATAATLRTAAQVPVVCQQCPGQPRVMVTQALDVGQMLRVDKLTSYTTSRDFVPHAADVVARARAELDGQDYDTLRAAQVQAWEALWHDCDVLIEGDAEAQRAIRFNLFQLIIAAPQHDDRVSIGAKTLSGLGYRGHVFWDTEIFILPFFTFTQPQLARNMLMYRYHTLAGARRKAAANGFSGAQYAWESAATGDEVTPTWVPDFSGKELVRIWTGDIEIHISADIAYAIMQYWQATGDDTFMRDYGAEVILDTARFWAERAEREEVDGRHRYSYRDVIGPDEYHDHVDNNVYTNRMAQWHLQTALDLLVWLDGVDRAQAGALRDKLDLTPARLRHWQDVIEHVVIHHDPDTGLLLQFEGFFDLKPIDPDVIASADRSMQVVLGIEGANASQVIKQADVIMLLCLLRDEYDARTWQANWDTYMPITDHRYGSSLGPSFHAWAACEMDRPDEGYDHFMLAARADLHDVRGNADDGIHGASAGGLWQAIVFGFAGLRLTGDGITVQPRLPSHWQRLRFSVRCHDELVRVDITQGGAVQLVRSTYSRQLFAVSTEA